MSINNTGQFNKAMNAALERNKEGKIESSLAKTTVDKLTKTINNATVVKESDTPVMKQAKEKLSKDASFQKEVYDFILRSALSKGNKGTEEYSASKFDKNKTKGLNEYEMNQWTEQLNLGLIKILQQGSVAKFEGVEKDIKTDIEDSIFNPQFYVKKLLNGSDVGTLVSENITNIRGEEADKLLNTKRGDQDFLKGLGFAVLKEGTQSIQDVLVFFADVLAIAASGGYVMTQYGYYRAKYELSKTEKNPQGNPEYKAKMDAMGENHPVLGLVNILTTSDGWSKLGDLVKSFADPSQLTAHKAAIGITTLVGLIGGGVGLVKGFAGLTSKFASKFPQLSKLSKVSTKVESALGKTAKVVDKVDNIVDPLGNAAGRAAGKVAGKMVGDIKSSSETKTKPKKPTAKEVSNKHTMSSDEQLDIKLQLDEAKVNRAYVAMMNSSEHRSYNTTLMDQRIQELQAKYDQLSDAEKKLVSHRQQEQSILKDKYLSGSANSVPNAERLSDASKLLDIQLTKIQQEAIIKAHHVPMGSNTQKGKILRDAGFTEKQTRALMESGICGWFDKISKKVGDVVDRARDRVYENSYDGKMELRDDKSWLQDSIRELEIDLASTTDLERRSIIIKHIDNSKEHLHYLETYGLRGHELFEKRIEKRAQNAAQAGIKESATKQDTGHKYSEGGKNNINNMSFEDKLLLKQKLDDAIAYRKRMNSHARILGDGDGYFVKQDQYVAELQGRYNQLSSSDKSLIIKKQEELMRQQQKLKEQEDIKQKESQNNAIGEKYDDLLKSKRFLEDQIDHLKNKLLKTDDELLKLDHVSRKKMLIDGKLVTVSPHKTGASVRQELQRQKNMHQKQLEELHDEIDQSYKKDSGKGDINKDMSRKERRGVIEADIIQKNGDVVLERGDVFLSSLAQGETVRLNLGSQFDLVILHTQEGFMIQGPQGRMLVQEAVVTLGKNAVEIPGSKYPNTVSGQHVKLIFDKKQGTVRIEDMSTNGTRIYNKIPG